MTELSIGRVSSAPSWEVVITMESGPRGALRERRHPGSLQPHQHEKIEASLWPKPALALTIVSGPSSQIKELLKGTAAQARENAAALQVCQLAAQ